MAPDPRALGPILLSQTVATHVAILEQERELTSTDSALALHVPVAQIGVFAAVATEVHVWRARSVVLDARVRNSPRLDAVVLAVVDPDAHLVLALVSHANGRAGERSNFPVKAIGLLRT